MTTIRQHLRRLTSRFRRMQSDPRDDFAVFAGHEHMFFGLRDPYRTIRNELEACLCAQVPTTIVSSIRPYDEPKWLTLGKPDSGLLTVSYFGFCVRSNVLVTNDSIQSELRATLTFLFGRVDEPGRARTLCHFDFGADSDRGFDGETFRERFLAFRIEDPDLDPVQ